MNKTPDLSPRASASDVTVITVTYNAAACIEKTLANVLAQQGVDIEYVVVDGASQDGTQAIIESYRARLAVWISEPDRGIYDAMNKAVSRASGEWVIFVNAGDWLCHERVLAEALSSGSEADLIYGDCYYDIEGELLPCRCHPLERIWQGMPFSHQAMLVRRRLLVEHPFDTKYRIAADYEFVVWLYVSGHRLVNFGAPMAVMDSTGVSRTERIRTYREYMRIAKPYYGAVRVVPFYLARMLSECIKGPLRSLLPASWLIAAKRRSAGGE